MQLGIYEHIYSPVRQTQTEKYIQRNTILGNIKHIVIELAQQITNSFSAASGCGVVTQYRPHSERYICGVEMLRLPSSHHTHHVELTTTNCTIHAAREREITSNACKTIS